MEKTFFSHKIFAFFLTRIAIGIVAIVLPVWFIEWAGRPALNSFSLSDDLKNLIIAIAESVTAVYVYIFLFRIYEKRKITELDSSGFFKNACLGFLLGLILQSLFIYILYLTGHYRISAMNPVSFMFPALTAALTAGFVAEVIIRGIVFRILEEKWGTIISILIMFVLFAILHAGVPNSNVLTVVSTAAQAGFLLSSVYVYCRNLWLPIFLHFAWDFTEPGIFGGINPGISVGKSWITPEISGPVFLTGGTFGPQNSLQAAFLCLLTGFIFLWLAKRKNNFIPFRTLLS